MCIKDCAWIEWSFAFSRVNLANALDSKLRNIVPGVFTLCSPSTPKHFRVSSCEPSRSTTPRTISRETAIRSSTGLPMRSIRGQERPESCQLCQFHCEPIQANRADATNPVDLWFAKTLADCEINNIAALPARSETRRAP